MTLGTLIRRSLRFHWRSHLGVVLGAAIGSAALIGALVVGDSVRQTLFWRAMGGLWYTSVALESGDRFFGNDLLSRMIKLGNARARTVTANLTNTAVTWGNGFNETESHVVLRLRASISTRDGDARANQIQLLGLNASSLGELQTGLVTFPGDKPPSWGEGGVLLNHTLAAHLNAKTGDEILVRVQKASALSHDSAIATRSDAAAVLRLRVAGVAMGSISGLSLNSGAHNPLNAFMEIDELGRAIGVESGANVILASPASRMRKLQWWEKFINGYKDSARQRDFGPLITFRWLKTYSLVGEPQDSQTTINALRPLLLDSFALRDAQITLPIHKLTSERTVVEARTPRIFLDEPMARAAFAADSNARPLLTYLATLLRAGTNATPYSMVTAAGAPWTPADLRDDEIVVSQWLADDLHVKPGDEIALSYFLPESGAKLEEATNTFHVRSIVPMEMPWADRTLMPDFPGLEKAESTRDWDAGFPLTYKIRPKDEDYWKQHRGTPKAFITLAAGQRMWGNRFGNLTAIRFPIPTNVAQTPEGRAGSPLPAAGANTNESAHRVTRPTNAEEYRAALEKKILANLKPEELGLRFEPVREQALKAAEESQDFGGLFLGFSFFLIAAALLLMAMLFQFGLEQRAPEIGTLLALGFTPKQVRKLLLREGVALAFLGGVLGAVGGIYFAKAMLHGLTTVWRDAVGATALNFHVTAQTLVIGLFASVVVSAITLWLALRKFVKREPRELLAGNAGAGEFRVQRLSNRFNAPGALVAALGIVTVMLLKGDTASAGAFFGAGALVLLAGVGYVSAWLKTMERRPPTGWIACDAEGNQRGESKPGARISYSALALRGCARRRKRSLGTVAMLACGSFLIVSIGVFRLDANRDATQKTSGTGGFALMGETTMPVVQDLNSQSGRDFFALSGQDMENVNVIPFRVREGDEASCLNLNAARKPRLLGVRPEMLARRFGFAKGTDWNSLINTRLQPGGADSREPANRLSGFSDVRPDATGLKSGVNEIEIPAIGDANSIQWAMHKKVGDTIDYVDERGQPFKVRIVGAVANSILQGQLIIDEAEFVKRFPGESGYRAFLIDAPTNRVTEVSATLSRAMQDVGLELTPAAQRLAQFNAVQNTNLGTFQVLGGLGLLLGSVGLGIVVLRNVLERRGELALLVAVGFRKRQVQRLLLIENGALLAAGLGVGVIAAAVAVLPAVLSPSAQLPVASLTLTLVAILLNGMLWTWLATRFAVRGDLLRALRNE